MPIVCVAVLRTTAWYFLSIKSTLVQNSNFFILYCQLLHILWDCSGYLKWTLDQYDIWWNWCGPKHGVKWHSMATWWSRDPNQGFKSNAEKGRQLHSCEEDIELCMSWKISALILLLAMSSQREHIGKKIANHYRANEIFESSRNANSLEHRWSTIHKECEYDSLWHICSCKLNMNPAEPPW